ncbi:MAG: gamma-glutamylcyclotransferase [Firmicutes bacterium]|nr:gamma-glutamylcyclotransferase [Bacillota bacterium]
MKRTFYRTETIDTEKWDVIKKQMKQDLRALEAGKVTREETCQYLQELLPQAEPLEHDPSMYFFGFDKPGHMPSDTRVLYFFEPTYLAAAILIQACVRWPQILTDGSLVTEQMPAEELRRVVAGILKGCTGRGFSGSGVEAFKGLLDTLTLFMDAGLTIFQEQCKDLCPEFTTMVRETLNELLLAFLHGPIIRDWETDFTLQVDDLLVKAGLIPEADPTDERYYLAYGSNLNIARMKDRCPDAELIGTTWLSDHRLVSRRSGSGFYLSIDEEPFHHVPAALWKIRAEDEARLDRYEGFPRHYQKKNVYVQIRKETVRALVYYLPEDRPAGVPTRDYMEICRQGYRDMHLDEYYLKEAMKYTKGIS